MSLLGYSRVLSGLDLTSVSELAEPPKLMVGGGGLGVSNEVGARVREGLVWVVDAGIEDGHLAGSDPRRD